MNMNNCNANSIKKRLMELSFALYETVLYLDGHPTCTDALEHYNTLIAELEQVTEQYEEKYGPLTIYSNTHDTWKWVSSPWPWESEAN